MEKIGIALDIDETLNWTGIDLAKKVLEKFGENENLSAEELIKKYRYTFNIPGWTSGEIDSYILELVQDNAFMGSINVMEDAKFEMEKLLEFAEIKAYISARHEIVRKGTTEWLENHGFPTAKIYLKPEELPRMSNTWKDDVLTELYPKVKIFVDDSLSLLKHVSEDYPGHIIIFDFVNNLNVEINRERVYICKTWKEIREKIKEISMI